jgi:YVTN family beta-propeller protein
MVKFTKGRGALRALIVSVSVALLATGILGCANPASSGGGSSSPAAYTTYLYMTDGTNGHVYYYDPSTHTGSSSSLLTAGGNGTAEIKFYKGIGYVANGYGGIYYFDPSSSSPSGKEIPGSSSLGAEYFAFYSATKAYVSVVPPTYAGNTGGVYYFNPSNLSAGLKQVASSTANAYMQEITVGPDNMIYVAENMSNAVLKIDPSSDSVTATITTNASGPSGLVSGTYNGNPGVFVADIGGSVDFIPEGITGSSTTATRVTSSSSTIYPGRLVQLSNGNLVATGYDPSYVNHTYLITLSGSAATVTEIKAGSSSFGSSSLAYNSTSGLVYVPYQYNGYSKVNAVNKLYVIDTNGNQQSYSPVSVMTPTDNIANVAFYQN